MAIARAVVSAWIKLESKEFLASCGDTIHDLRYVEDGQEKVVTGVLRAMVVNTIANNQIPDDCPPEPYAHKYIKVLQLIVDHSDELNAQMAHIPVSSILDIRSISNESNLELTVDQTIMKIPNASVTMVSDRVYDVTTQTGNIAGNGLFDQIISHPDVAMLTVSSGTTSYNCAGGASDEQIQSFNALVDALLPKTLDDPVVSLAITIDLV